MTAVGCSCWCSRPARNSGGWRIASTANSEPPRSAPTISLAEARSKREEVKKILREGKDPAGTGRAQKAAKAAAMTFREVAEDWYATKMIAEGKATTTFVGRGGCWMRSMKISATDRLLKSSRTRCSRP